MRLEIKGEGRENGRMKQEVESKKIKVRRKKQEERSKSQVPSLTSQISHLKSRKSQTVSEIFVIIVAALVLIMIILWGSRAIKSFTERTDDAKLVNFINSLKQDVEKVAFQRGTARKVEIQAPGGFTKVCFTEKSKVVLNAVKQPPNYPYTAIPKIVVDRATKLDQNVFFIPPSEISIKIKNMTVSNKGIVCLDVKDGNILFRAEGTGRTVCVSQWDPTISINAKTCEKI